ncbi:type II CAAX prenyl endopeptidase Rce1 family protein [Capilliphycus salinus ALCB114379]|uniref:CPBP family glutamic-type intramembrane protease n=1 Tax=Capilliphycus salinus TaxID=2768948 RepID=UPI0039A594A1
MTPKRIILGILTLLTILLVGGSLIDSITQPQIQSRLELYQTNLILHATEWKPEQQFKPDFDTLRNNIIGENAAKSALQQYENVQEAAQDNLERIQTLEPASQSIIQLKQLQDELEIRIGLLQTEQGKTEEALNTWQSFVESNSSENTQQQVELAKVLRGLWSEPPRILPNAESTIESNLEGWFSYQALSRLYQLQERQQDLQALQAKEQEIAEQAVVKLTIISAIPGVGLFAGVILLLVLGIQFLFKGKESILAKNTGVEWLTPWDWETILQVFILGFFLVGQLAVPLVFGLIFNVLNINPANFDVRRKAFYVLANYGFLTAGGLSVLYFSLKSFFPLPKDWFNVNWKTNWFLWGLGGYVSALPLVILVSLINQQLWDGQGGSNPLLPIALENRDPVALVIFFVTASIAAPVFEEIMFRGFLLPSLTRYMSLGSAILLSSLFFAIAHMNISEVIPLMTLGIVLGFVYTRSRNLLSSMLLHCLWNSGTLLSLYILGSGSA